MKSWLAEDVAQAYRDQGVPWSEAETLQKAEQVAREILKMNFHDCYAERKHRRNEVPWDVVCDDNGAIDRPAFRKRERIELENWARGWNGRPAEKPSAAPGPRMATGARIAKRKPDYSKHGNGAGKTHQRRGEKP